MTWVTPFFNAWFVRFRWFQRQASRAALLSTHYGRRKQRLYSLACLFVDPAATQQAVERGETRVDGHCTFLDPARHFVDAGKAMLTDFAVLITRRKIGRPREVVDENLLGLWAFRQRLQHISGAPRHGTHGDFLGNAGFFPAFL